MGSHRHRFASFLFSAAELISSLLRWSTRRIRPTFEREEERPIQEKLSSGRFGREPRSPYQFIAKSAKQAPTFQRLQYRPPHAGSVVIILPHPPKLGLSDIPATYVLIPHFQQSDEWKGRCRRHRLATNPPRQIQARVHPFHQEYDQYYHLQIRNPKGYSRTECNNNSSASNEKRDISKIDEKVTESGHGADSALYVELVASECARTS